MLPTKFGIIKNTNIPLNNLREIGIKLSTIPEDFQAHP